jgi:6-pyruvoyltetrahydropterin/6-carboxytetrahydropterin synthase
MKWVIDKTIEGCYGHRVWSQSLIEEFSQMTVCKCKRLHGHQLTLKVFLEANHLEGGMVTDFHHLNWLKKFIDDYIDHKFIVDIRDPLYNNFIPEHVKLKPLYVLGVVAPTGFIVDIDQKIGGLPIKDIDREWYESFFVVTFVPTSENLSKWIFDIASEKMVKLGKITRVDWHETPKSRASYQN